MNQSDEWPPPAWIEVVVMWETMLNYSDRNPNDIIEWCRDYPGHGRWHFHGYQINEGFEFRIEDARDATAFGLRWI